MRRERRTGLLYDMVAIRDGRRGEQEMKERESEREEEKKRSEVEEKRQALGVRIRQGAGLRCFLFLGLGNCESSRGRGLVWRLILRLLRVKPTYIIVYRGESICLSAPLSPAPPRAVTSKTIGDLHGLLSIQYLIFNIKHKYSIK